ncbi:MAG: protein kinase [Candidatus Wallbacteria bacterium]|nr:protein kinase [Candidatus Wallbacteria bacterium]
MDSKEKQLSILSVTYIACGGFLLLMAFLEQELVLSPLCHFFLIIPLLQSAVYFRRKGFLIGLLINVLLSFNTITIYQAWSGGRKTLEMGVMLKSLFNQTVMIDKPGILICFLIFFIVGWYIAGLSEDVEVHRVLSETHAAGERKLKSDLQKLEETNKSVGQQIKDLADNSRVLRMKLTTRIETLKEITTRIVRFLNEDEIIDQVLKACSSLLAVERAAVFMETKNNIALEMSASIGYPPGKFKFMERGKGMIGWVFENKQMLTSDIVRRNYQLADLMKQDMMRITVCAPLYSGKDRVGGVLVIDYSKDKEIEKTEEPSGGRKREGVIENEVADDDLRLIGILADVASLALQNARYHDKSLTMADQPFDKIDDPQIKMEKMYKIGKTYEDNEMYEGAMEIYQAIVKIDVNYRDVPKKVERLKDILAIQNDFENKGIQFSEDMRKRYRHVEKVGIGGMGIVYKALDTTSNEIVAIKVIAEKYRGNQKTIQRFIKRDGMLAKILDHQNIVRVFDVIEGEVPHIVMEFVEGESFRKILNRMGRLQPMHVKRIALQVAAGLGYAHSKNIVHRDIKPDNIMLHQNRIVKVMDFGLAKMVDMCSMTETGEVFGTLYYMPPEQLKGDDVCAATDLYALGVALYEFLTGTLPFKGNNPEQVMYKIFNKVPPPPSKICPGLTPELDHVIMRSIEKSLDKRYKTAEEFATDMKEVKLKSLI